MGRRSNGAGTQRKDGRWQAQVTVFDVETGEPKKKLVYGKTQKDVQEKIREVLGKVKDGTFIEPTKITLGEWLTTWLNDYMKPSLRLTTWESYQMQVKKHLKPSLGHIRLAQLQTNHLQKLYNKKLTNGRADGKEGGLAPKSVRYIHTILHGALEQAMKEGLIAKNPAKAVKLPKVTKKEMRTLDSAGITTFLAEAKDSRDYPAYLLELSTGLRRGELLGLRWKDVDLETGTLSVRQQLVPTGEGLKFQEPKTHLSRRTLSIPANVIRELRAHKARQAQERLLLGEAYQNNDLVFCTEDGRPLDPRALTRRFERLIERAGLPKMAFHDLRHTFATLSLQEGVSVRTIQETLGHHTAAFTMSTYSHVTDRMRQDATDKIGHLLEGCIRE